MKKDYKPEIDMVLMTMIPWGALSSVNPILGAIGLIVQILGLFLYTLRKLG